MGAPSGKVPRLNRIAVHSPSAGQSACVARVSGPRTVTKAWPRWHVTTSSTWHAATDRNVPARSLWDVQMRSTSGESDWRSVKCRNIAGCRSPSRPRDQRQFGRPARGRSGRGRAARGGCRGTSRRAGGAAAAAASRGCPCTRAACSDLSSRSSRLVNSPRPSRSCDREQLPQDARRQAADQVLAVDQHALVGLVEGHLAAQPARPCRGRPQAATAAARPRRRRRRRRSALAQHRVLDRERQVRPSSSIVAWSSSWKRYGVSLSSTGRRPARRGRTAARRAGWPDSARPGSGMRSSSAHSPCASARLRAA